MLDWADCDKLIQNCMNQGTESEKDSVDVEGTRRINTARYMFGSVKIKFKSNTSRDVVWSFKKRLDNIIKNTEECVPLPALLVDGLALAFLGSSLKVSVECAPWKRDHVKAVGRFCGAFRSVTQAQVVINIRGEIGPPRSKIWTVATQAVRPINIATFTTTTNTWVVDEPSFEQMKAAFPGLTVTKEALEAEVSRRQ